MQKNPTTKEDQIQESKPKKVKKNKHPTTCVDKVRHILNCGICGSENLVWSGVVGCNNCGEEKYYIVEGYSWHKRNHNETDTDCDCKDIYDMVKRKYTKYRIEIESCVDCGAMKSTICPACKRYGIWSDKHGLKKNCQHCGYRS